MPRSRRERPITALREVPSFLAICAADNPSCSSACSLRSRADVQPDCIGIPLLMRHQPAGTIARRAALVDSDDPNQGRMGHATKGGMRRYDGNIKGGAARTVIPTPTLPLPGRG